MRLLAGQYRQLGRTDDCADILVRLKALHPTAEVRRELVRTYLQIAEVELWRGRGHKAVAALRQTLPFRFARGRPPELSMNRSFSIRRSSSTSPGLTSV